MPLLCRYRYDPLDRLASREPAAQASTQQFYLKNRLAVEIQGQVQSRLIQHDDLLLAQWRGDGGSSSTALLVTDQQRSVLHVLDGQVQQPMVYTPYGHRTVSCGIAHFPGFNGERIDPVTGHYFLGNGYRAFNPVLMRFNSPDSLSPFGKGGLNAYVYCAGNPVNQRDPTGQFVSHLSGFINNMINLRKLPTLTGARVVSSPIARPANYLEELLDTTNQLLTRNEAFTGPVSPARAHLEDSLRTIKNRPPFVQKLGEVNKNLASHGNDSLSIDQAKKYAALAHDVNSGTISNTTAHVRAAAMWGEEFAKNRRPSGILGVGFNSAAALFSGADDASYLKTGRALRGNSNKTTR